MDEIRGKRPLIVLSSEDEEDHYQEQEDDDDCDEEQEDDDDCDEEQEDDEHSDYDDESDDSDNDDDDDDDDDEEQEDDEHSDYDDESDDSDNDDDDDDESHSDKGNDIESLTLQECKTYLRTHGLRLAGNRAVCVDRIKEHLRKLETETLNNDLYTKHKERGLKDGNGYAIYPRSSFNINCTGDVCKGDVVLFRQRVYEKFDKVTRHGRILGNRTIAGRVVKESYGAAKQQHTFTVDVLWSSGFRKLSPLSPLLVKGRNLYKQKTYRQRWENEADRVKVLSEKHRRGAAARVVRAMRQKKSSCANGSNGSKRQLEIQNTKRSKIGRFCELDKVSHLGGCRKALEFRPQEAFRSTRGWQKFAESDHYQAPSYPSYSSYGQRSYLSHVNFQSRNEPSQFLYYERGLIPSMIGFPPFRPYVGELTSRSRPLVSSDCHHAHTNLRYK